ncbi:MAG: hypothetical protein ACT4QD_15420 [Acidobacteriota bacterium]
MDRHRDSPKRRSKAGVSALALVVLAASLNAQRSAPPGVARDPAVGAWRGTMRVGAETPTPLVLSIVRRGDGYDGAINLGGANEIPVRRVTVAASDVRIEAGAGSKLGEIVIALNLTLQGDTLGGGGTLSVGPLPVAVTIALQRQMRADVLQPVVQQRASYFVGRWSFEYIGGVFPPLSPGSRTGTATFTSTGADAVDGTIDGAIDDRPYRERWSMTFDPATQMLAVVERRAGGLELLSVASWQTPLAIRFTTAPVREGGQSYQLRRLLRVISSSSFTMTEEFSVDGGPFRRLGQATFEKDRE